MTVATKSAAIILNPRSGAVGRRASPEEIASALTSAALEHSIEVLSDGESAAVVARRLVERGADTVVACGGDGTVSAVASSLAGTTAAMGILPLGTLNHFAKDLQLPMNLAEAARVISQRNIHEVDVAEVNGRVFVNNSSLGIYPDIVIVRERRRRGGWNKWVALGVATMKVLRRYPFVDVRVNVQGRQIAQRTPFVFVANNEYEIRGLNIGLRKHLDEGRLYLYVAARVSRLGLVWLAGAALLGLLDKSRSLQKFAADEAWIETRKRRVSVSKDGEVLKLATPLHYRLRPRELKVIVP